MDDSVEIVPEDEAEAGPAALKKLREKLALAVKEKQEYLEGWQRARADFTNFKKEESRREEEHINRLKREFAESIIPTLDSFEMAFKNPQFEKSSSDWKTGFTAIFWELRKAIEKLGIVAFSPLSEPFDPHRHEAVRSIPVEAAEQDHVVVSVERQGYSIGDTIIRPAQVTIGSYNKS